eukprot:7865194-Pyramimonas_sp.AAC.1
MRSGTAFPRMYRRLKPRRGRKGKREPRRGGQSQGLGKMAGRRARAVGLAGYYQGLGIRDRALYDAVGMHFDPRRLQRRIVTALRAWREGRPTDVTCTPAPTGGQIAQGWGSARTYAGGQCPWAQLRDRPLPDDLAEQLLRRKGSFPGRRAPRFQWGP